MGMTVTEDETAVRALIQRLAGAVLA